VRRKITILGITILTVGGSAAVTLAATDARLGGDFKMRGQIISSRGFIDQKAGDSVTRIYKFRPRCATGVCNVTFRRQRGDGSFLKSIAQRVDPGVYKAVDRARSDCISGGRVVGHTTVTTRTKITIKRAREGKATRIAASLLVTAPKAPGCVSRRQTASLTGTRR
jgi:hypothetical protein